MSIIFSKTAKGQEEIKTRAGGLSQRMRQILISIDGKRSREDLIDMFKGDDVDDILRLLVEQNYADVSGIPEKPKQAAPAAAATLADAPAPSPAKAESKVPEPAKLPVEEMTKKQREEEEQAQLAMARSFMGKMS